jgi:predicted AlkP superfamily pyrophosphatase or phosphodiesterase
MSKRMGASAAALFVLGAAFAANASPVLMISIDGLRPADVIDAKARGMTLPVLSGLSAHGAYASDVVNVIPTVTYPNHTTLITGVWPSVHGISSNTTFDPLRRNMDGWYWYAEDIKVPTLWDVAHAKGEVASIGWPVSVGARSIDFDIPEYWRANNTEDVKLLRDLSTPGLTDALAARSGAPLSMLIEDSATEDEGKARYAVALYETKRPVLFTLHLSTLDHVQHIWGPGTPQAHATLETIDGEVGRVVAAARRAEPDVTVVIVSDHGFAPVHDEVNLYRPFIDAGLITVGPATGKITGWAAMPWGGASAAIVLARPDDAALRDKVKALLSKLAADPAFHIDRVIDRAEIERRGAAKEASFYVDFDLGYEMGQDVSAPPLRKSLARGMHGWFNDHPEMHSTFIIDGPGVARRGDLGRIDMRDIAPTAAKIIGVALPTAQGRPLF